MGDLIQDMIDSLKSNGINPPYCMICHTFIDHKKAAENHPEITKVQIDPDISDEMVFIYPCNGEFTRSNIGKYEITFVP